MSTYAVFGMTRNRALEAARKTVDPSKDGKVLPESEWLALVDEEADRIMQGTRVIQLSEKFDSPDVAQQFLELAKKAESRDLRIRAHNKTGAHTKTGRPEVEWIEIDAETGEPVAA